MLTDGVVSYFTYFISGQVVSSLPSIIWEYTRPALNSRIYGAFTYFVESIRYFPKWIPTIPYKPTYVHYCLLTALLFLNHWINSDTVIYSNFVTDIPVVRSMFPTYWLYFFFCGNNPEIGKHISCFINTLQLCNSC